jgi:hypothetical protein
MKEGHYLIDYLCKATGESSVSYHEGEYDKWLKERNIETSREGWWSYEAFDMDNITGYVVSQIKPTLHTIKPLEWEMSPDAPYFLAKTPFGFYEVTYSKNGWDWFRDNEYQATCTSIEDGKAQAEAHYREQLGKCLEVYNG